MMNPLVSVIIPVYNVERYIDRCLRSVVAQTYQNMEIILIDDGSTDLSGEICNEYAKNNMNIFVLHQNNQGQSIARNNAVKIAKGEYICFIDSDDYVSADYVERLVDVYQRYNADISIIKMKSVSAEYDASSDYANKGNEIRILDTEEALNEMLYGRLFDVSPCGKLYQKSILLQHPYPDGKIYEDLATTFKIIGDCNRIVFINTVGYFYVFRQGSTMHSRINESQLNSIYAASEQLSYIINNFPNLEDAASSRCVCVALGVLSRNDIFNCGESKLIFYYLQKYIKKYAKKALLNRNMYIRHKILCIVVLMGYYPSKFFWCYVKRFF